MLDQCWAKRRRRWPNIDPTLGQCLVFAGVMADDGERSITATVLSTCGFWNRLFPLRPHISQVFADAIVVMRCVRPSVRPPF